MLFFQTAPHFVNEIPDPQKCHLESIEPITLHKTLTKLLKDYASAFTYASKAKQCDKSTGVKYQLQVLNYRLHTSIRMQSIHLLKERI